MQVFFRFLLFSFLTLLCSQALPALAAPPDEWHHIKTSLTSLKTGWSSNRHYLLSKNDNSQQKTDGCGLVHFELPPFFSASAFDRDKIHIALSLTTYLPADSIHPQSGLEISSIDPKWSLSKDEEIQMTVESGAYKNVFKMRSEPPATWIAPIEKKSLIELLKALENHKELNLSFTTGEALSLKLGHIRSVADNFQACLLETGFLTQSTLSKTAKQP